ncbi:MAG: SpoIIE family protein phosphatase [Anaerolineaceae bacterium]|nr:MAG: SpoIIE family protein phosphatase [Anaerolineaceae bacterium]
MTLVTHLNKLETAGLIRVAQVEPELEYLFRHTLVREAAYTSLLTNDRKRLHFAVGEAVERMYPDRLGSREIAATLARHFREAGDDQRALKYYTVAAEAALASYANQEAERHHRRALALVRSERERAALLSGLGEALYAQSRYDEAIQVWREGIVLYQALGPEGYSGLARLYARSARAAWHGGDPPNGLKLSQEGLEAVEDAPESHEVALLVHEAGRAYFFNGLPEEAESLCRRALEMAEHLGALDVQADALATIGVLPNQPDEVALESLTRAVEIAESAGLLDIAHRAHHNLGVNISNFLGDQRAAHDHYLKAAELARKRGVPYEELFSLINAITISLGLGELAFVEENLPTVEQLINTISDPAPARLNLRGIQAELMINRGKWAEALQLLRTSQSEAQQRGDLQALLNNSVGIANVLTELDRLGEPVDWGEADAVLKKAIEISDRGVGGRVWPRCLMSIVHARQGAFNDARVFLKEAGEVTGPTPTIWDEGSLKYTEAELAAAEKRWSDALAAYEIVAGIAARLEMRPWWAGMLRLWADVYISRGEPTDLERAQALLREALSAYEDMGLSYFAGQVEEKLRDARAKTYDQAIAHQQITEEMAQARRIQESFLPEEIPDLPGWQLSAILEPARETSGDYYDFISLPDGQIGIVVADVADKGAAAALYMTSSRTLIRSYAAEFLSQPELVLSSVNHRILTETHAGLFVTIFYGILDPTSGRLIYCNAGHNPPYLFSSQEEGTVQELHKTGMALGIAEGGTWDQGEAMLAPGDVLIIYSDGLTEAQNEQETLFSEERVEKTAKTNLGRSAQEIQEAMLEEVHSFVGDAPRSDDLTLVILKRDDPLT